MLRIWDCFLLEGPKVLFRFALALLELHQDTVLERNDTISVMKVLKAAARLTFDIDGLVKVSITILSNLIYIALSIIPFNLNQNKRAVIFNTAVFFLDK